MVTRRQCGSDRDSCSAASPATCWTHCATRVMAHRQVVLRTEVRCVDLVRRGCNGVRNSSTIAPIAPDVANVRATALWRRCGNGVA
jgi:hypothetical protein